MGFVCVVCCVCFCLFKVIRLCFEGMKVDVECCVVCVFFLSLASRKRECCFWGIFFIFLSFLWEKFKMTVTIIENDVEQSWHILLKCERTEEEKKWIVKKRYFFIGGKKETVYI